MTAEAAPSLAASLANALEAEQARWATTLFVRAAESLERHRDPCRFVAEYSAALDAVVDMADAWGWLDNQWAGDG